MKTTASSSSSKDPLSMLLDTSNRDAPDAQQLAYREMIKTILREKNQVIMKDYMGGVIEASTDEFSAVGGATDTSSTVFSDDDDSSDDEEEDDDEDESSDEDDDSSDEDSSVDDASDSSTLSDDELDEEKDEELEILEHMAAEIARLASESHAALPTKMVAVPRPRRISLNKGETDRSVFTPVKPSAITAGTAVPDVVEQPQAPPQSQPQSEPPKPEEEKREEEPHLKEIPLETTLSSVAPKTYTVTFGTNEIIEEVKPAFGASGDVSPTLRLLEMVGAEGPEDLFIPTEDVEDYFVEHSPEQVAAYTTQFVRALRRHDLAEIQRLHQEEGHLLQASNVYGETVVHIACRRGALDIIRYMVEHAGVSIRVRDDYGRTPLHDSCWTAEPHVELLSYLVHLEPDLLFMTDTKGFTPLEYARLEHRAVWNEFLEQIHDVVTSRCEGGILKLKCAI